MSSMTGPATDIPADKLVSRKRFQKRVPSAEALVGIYEHNVMGATAGFFCAIWAGRLMNEPVSCMFTTLNYKNAHIPYYYYFGAKDLALVILGISKVLFLRTASIRFILRPILHAACPRLSFACRTQLATAIFAALVHLILAGSGIWIAGANEDRQVYEMQSNMIGISVTAKIFVLLQFVFQAAEISVRFIEGPSLSSLPFAKLTSLLVLLATVAAGTWGMLSIAGVIVAASNVSQLMADVFSLNALLADA
ncbi:hypothetical protein BX667DRAFT_502665, partial [Coemansia mojavensis]